MTLVIALLCFAAGVQAQLPQYTRADSLLVTRLLQEARNRTDSALSPLFFARKFTGTPYVGATLDRGDAERLVVNLRGMDCTTFVENMLALSLTAMQGRYAFHDFAETLRSVRYRGGVLDGYVSRLHYFSEWISDNQRKGFVREITGCMGSDSLEIAVNYMSSHPAGYPQMQAHPGLTAQIRNVERALSGRKAPWLPKEKLARSGGLPEVRDGDIVAITTNIPGLDIVHTGFAVRSKEDGRLYLLHASSQSGRVLLETTSLPDYLLGKPNTTGIRILRPVASGSAAPTD